MIVISDNDDKILQFILTKLRPVNLVKATRINADKPACANTCPRNCQLVMFNCVWLKYANYPHGGLDNCHI